MNKEEDKYKLPDDFINAYKRFLQELDEYGWEINDEGDIVEKSTKRLVWDITNGFKK